MKSVTFKTKVYTPESLAEMSTSALAELHNDLVKALKSEIKPVNRFADKASAIKRTKLLLQEFAVRAPASEPALSKNPTKEELEQLSLDTLLKIYNEKAKALGLAPVGAWSSKETAVKRTLGVIKEAAAVTREKETPSPKPTPAPKAQATRRTPPEAKVIAGSAPGERQTVLFNLHSLASSRKTWGREDLVTAFLEKYTPPRSGSYNRTYVMGYVAHALKAGILVVAGEA